MNLMVFLIDNRNKLNEIRNNSIETIWGAVWKL